MLNPEDTLRQRVWAGESGRCSNPICCKPIVRHDEFFDDVLNLDEEAAYCSMCGTMLRYHRKKAGQRKDPIPANFDEVGKINE